MTKEEFYEGITKDTRVNEEFLMKLHGYSFHDPQFLLDVMIKFDSFGRKRVSDVFTVYMYLYNARQDAELLPAAKWLRQQIDKEYEERRKAGEEQRKQQIKQDLQQRSDGELLNLLQSVN